MQAQTVYRDGTGRLAEEYFYDQIVEDLEVALKKGAIPLEGHEKIPRSLGSGKSICDVNAIAAELHAEACGCTSNVWILGADIDRIQKETGKELQTKRGAKPVLFITGKYSDTRPNGQEFAVQREGAKHRAQYGYNLDDFDVRSRLILEKQYKHVLEQDKERCQESKKIAQENFTKEKNAANRGVETEFSHIKTVIAQETRDNGLSTLYHHATVHHLEEYIGESKAITPEKRLEIGEKLKQEIEDCIAVSGSRTQAAEKIAGAMYKGMYTARRLCSRDGNFAWDRTQEEKLQNQSTQKNLTLERTRSRSRTPDLSY